MNDGFNCAIAYINELANLKEELANFYNSSSSDKENYRIDRINKQIQYAIRNSRFYKNKLEDKYTEIHNGLDLEKLPFISKNEMKKSLEHLLCVDYSQVMKYGETTGSSGPPSGAFVSRRNWIQNSLSMSHILSKSFNQNDFVNIALPYELSFAAQDIDITFQIINSTIISTGCLTKICSWERMLHIMYRMPINTLVCSPTRMLRLIDLAASLKLDISKFSINKLLCTGEAFPIAKQKKISKLWNNSKVFTCYGTSETNGLAASCPHGNLHCFEERYYFEVVDTNDNRVLNDGEIGELVLTSLNNVALPLIRYKTGDLVKLRHMSCECGLAGTVIEHYGRIGDELRIGTKCVPILCLEEAILNTLKDGYWYYIEQKDDAIKIFLENGFNTNFLDELIHNLNCNLKLDIPKDKITITPTKKDFFLSLVDNSSKPSNVLIKK